MRFLSELGVFSVIAAVAFAIVFGITWVIGGPIGLEVSNAAILAGVILCFWLPAFMNVHIAVRTSRGQKSRQRITAGIRAFGMLMCSAVLTASLVATGFPFAWGGALFVLGIVCWWGSFVFDQIRG